MKFASVSLIAALVSAASALTPADTSKAPEGNPISAPGLNQQVPVGAPFHITWNPTTPGSVSILLLRGPSTNVVPIATIADSVPNNGEFTWTPPTTLENDVTHYGIEIVVEGTGQYQYSTQFGIKNDQAAAPSVSPKVHQQVPTSTFTLRPATSTPMAKPTSEAPAPASPAPVQSQSPVEKPPSPEPTKAAQPVVTPAPTVIPTPATPAGAPYSTGGTLKIFSTASNYPIPKQSGIPFPYSNGAGSNSIALGSMFFGALAAFAF